ncbi:hypothetical protein Taro_009480 [Colocasia esculenta]|uniref:Uncharacterized protein n=1 Tax=Colocasia esculenta TaxID=4460 RepID=A0A843U465_COLES|nr:hypothetical protein [Colocasia esculenta]
MNGLRPMFIERLGPHNIGTYAEMFQRAQLVEDTMAKVEGMRGKETAKPVFVKKGAANTAATFCNNNNNNYHNNNKRPSTGRDYSSHNFVKVVSTQVHCVSPHPMYPASSQSIKESVVSTHVDVVST